MKADPEAPGAVTAVPDGPPQRLRKWLPWVIGAATLVLLTTASFRPLVGHCDERIIGAPGDATAGGVWTAYNYSQIPGLPWEDRTDLTGAPTGEPWWQPQFVPSTVLFTPLWAAGNLIDPVCAWNLTVVGGFLTTGVAVFAFVRWLTRRTDIAVLGMVAYTFSPYRQMKAAGHVAYVYAFGFPALIATSVWLWRRPDAKRAALAGAALALVGYTDGYYLLIGGVTFATIHAAALAHQLVVERTPVRELLRPVLAVLGAGAVAMALFVPIGATMLTSSDQLSATLTRSANDIVVYAARPWEFVVPFRAHPVFDDVFGEWSDRHLHESNYSEQSLYVGWVILIGVIVAAVGLARSRRLRQRPVAPNLRLGFVAAILGAVAVVTLLFSAPGTTYIGDQPIPMPSRVVYTFLKLWRVYARFFIVIHLAVVALACLGWAWVTDRLRPPLRTAATAALAAILIFEMSVGFSPDWWTYRATPAIYRQAAAEPGDILAEYPLDPTSAAPDNSFLTWQPVHQKRLFNVRQDGTEAAQLRRGLFGLGDPQTLPALRTLGVDLIVLRPGQYRGDITDDLPDGLELVDRFTYREERAENPVLRSGRWPWLRTAFDAELHRVSPGPRGAVALAIGRNSHDPEPREWGSFRWLAQDAEVTAVRLAGNATRASIAFKLEPGLGLERTVEFLQRGRTLHRVTVSASDTPVQMEVEIGVPVIVRTEQGATEIGNGDTRRITVGMSFLDARPVATHDP